MNKTKKTPALPLPPATAIIMAGGKSSRMGTDKSQLRIGDRSLIEHILNQLKPHFAEILVSANDIPLFESLGVSVIPDRIPDRGPVMGMVCALENSSNELNFFQACDIPDSDLTLIGHMLRCEKHFDAVVPRNPTGRIEPLFAVYRKTALRAMHHVLAKEKGRATRIVAHCNAKFIDLQTEDVLRNLNTQVDYQSFLNE